MQISWEQLNRLPVFTESGRKVGLVEGVEVDIDAHAVSHYVIKPASVVKAFFAGDLLIAPAEVVSITSEKMTVKDTITALEATNKGRRLVMATPETEIEMSETK